jgi:O-antigen/teichoic acid export membrane protein
MFRIIKSFLFENHSVRQTIAKNTVWLFSGQIISRLFRAAIVIYAARILGAGSWGAFSYALGIATFLTVFSDIGINALITKEASKRPELKDQYLSTAFFTKLTLLVVLVLGVVLAFPYLTKIEESAVIMPILIFVFAFDTLRDLGSALARALQKMQIEAGIQVFTNFLIVALGFVLLATYGTSYALAYAYAIGSALGFVAIVYILRDHFKHLFRNFNKKLVKQIIVTAWPFGLLGIMGVIMLNTDIIMLGWLTTAEEVGFYAAAQKLIQVLYVLPSLLAVSIFPIMSKLAKVTPTLAKSILEKSVALTIIVALPIALIGVVFGAPIIELLFGVEYIPSILTFQILMVTILIVYPSSLIGHAIFAYDQQKHFIKYVAVSAVGNVLFNLALIPVYGIEGAAVSTILTQAITNFLIWRKMKQVNQFRVLPQIKSYARILVGYTNR